MATTGKLNASSAPEAPTHSVERVSSAFQDAFQSGSDTKTQASVSYQDANRSVGSECVSPKVIISGDVTYDDPGTYGSQESGETVYITRGVAIPGSSMTDLTNSHVLSQMSWDRNDLRTAPKTTSRHSRFHNSRLSGRTACDSVALSLRALESIQSKVGEIDNWYVLEKPPIKEGSFGKIFRGVAKEQDDRAVAVKTVTFQSITSKQDQASFEFELHISRQLKHPNIVHLFDTIKDDGEGQCWYLVMELCNGGDLFDLIKANCGPGRFKEPVLARFIYQMLDGIKYCHHHCFCHRDIKPENYMLSEQGMGSTLKLIDFGLATAFEPGTIMTLRCGTLHYSAPEALRCKYTEKCDIWGIGVVFYMLCIGQWPFFDKNEMKLSQIIASGPDVFGEQNATQTAAFDRASGDKVAIKALIKDLLCPDVAKRPAAKDVLSENAWIAKARLLPLKGRGCCDIL